MKWDIRVLIIIIKGIFFTVKSKSKIKIVQNIADELPAAPVIFLVIEGIPAVTLWMPL